jgi:DNA-binding MarR family transcriptional regulator
MTAEAVAVRPEIAPLADSFVRLTRAFTRARARLIAAAQHDVEWTAQLILKTIATNGGPMRAAELADALQSDPSTVSRQVATLVKEGYLERRADPADGRASLLALTEHAHDLLTEHEQIRLEYFARVLEGWSDADVKRFAALLQRFTDDYETTATDWIAERVAKRAGRAERVH